jgi:hypothetical protein
MPSTWAFFRPPEEIFKHKKINKLKKAEMESAQETGQLSTKS